MTRCGVREDLDNNSDHLPVEIEVDIQITEDLPEPQPNYSQTNVKQLNEEITLQLQHVAREETQGELNYFSGMLIEVLDTAIKLSTPARKKQGRVTPGFTPECKEATRQTRRARRKYQEAKATLGGEHWRTQAAEEDWRRQGTEKKTLIRDTLRQNHRDKLSQALGDPMKVWKIVKWAKTRDTPFQPFTPDLQRPNGTLAVLKRDKTDLLAKSFFSQPPPADVSDIEGYQYPEPIDFSPITATEIKNAIRKASPNKAPGSDKIPNVVLQMALPALLPSLVWFFNQCIRLGHHPINYKHSMTKALRKPGKDDYSQPKAYRPIALLSTMGKALESVIASRLLYSAERFDLLPKSHFGRRKGTTTEHAMHTLIEKIHSTWRQDRVCSLLCLDVSGAFDNVNHPRLLHNLRKRRIGGAIVRWVQSFISEQSTRIELPDYRSKDYTISTGIPQGSGVSPPLYIYYNGDLVTACTDEELESIGIGYIDDVGILVCGGRHWGLHQKTGHHLPPVALNGPEQMGRFSTRRNSCWCTSSNSRNRTLPQWTWI